MRPVRSGPGRDPVWGWHGQALATLVAMAHRNQRPQKTDEIPLDDLKPLVVRPLVNVEDRVHNPKDIDVDTAAIRNGIEHGGTTENHVESRVARGAGGRKRTGAFGRSRAGRDLSKPR